MPATDQFTVCAAPKYPVRDTVKVNGVDPLLPSALAALAAATENCESSVKTMLLAEAVPIDVPALAEDKVTAKASSISIALSPATLTVIVWLVWPAAKFTVPDGNTPPTKSAPFTGFAPVPATVQVALAADVVVPVRVTVKVNGVVAPAAPSNFALALGAIEIDDTTSSFKIVPVALAVPIDDWPEAFDRVTANVSSASVVVSPTTFTVTVWLLWPAAKFSVPVGKAPPTKSAAVAAFAPVPATAHFTVCAAPRYPERLTVNV